MEAAIKGGFLHNKDEKCRAYHADDWSYRDAFFL
jgi:hypothetical protein